MERCKKSNTKGGRGEVKDICVICNEISFERCIGGDRYNKDFLKEFNIDFESIYEDSWKGYYAVCDKCLGKYKKKKQREALIIFRNKREYYLENGSPTHYQCGRMDGINFFIKELKDYIKTTNSFDGEFEAWLRGVFEVVKDVKEVGEE